MVLLAPSGVADVLDRLVILAIKLEHVPESGRANVSAELAALLETWAAAGLPAVGSVPEHAALDAVNRALWNVEDRLRAAELRGEFGASFVADARSVYQLNDRRAALKRAVNDRFRSRLREEKVHPG